MSLYCLEGRTGNQAVGRSSIRDIAHLAALSFFPSYFLFCCSCWILSRSDIQSNVTGSYKAESGILRASTGFCRGEWKPPQIVKLLCVQQVSASTWVTW